jgi:uroporphyrinogen-III synthase
MAAALKKYGYECFLCPMLHIEPLAINFDSYHHFKDVIITSNVAAKILVSNINYAINVWVVGKKAADVLAENKNIKIIQIASNITELESNMPKMRGALIYYSGNNITKSLPGIYNKIIYNVSYNRNIPQNFINMIDSINVTLFYSYNTARHFIRLLDNNNLTYKIKDKNIVALSEKIALLFNGITENVFFSKNNNNYEILEILKCLKK